MWRQKGDSMQHLIEQETYAIDLYKVYKAFQITILGVHGKQSILQHSIVPGLSALIGDVYHATREFEKAVSARMPKEGASPMH